jgi:hypothetical protein
MLHVVLYVSFHLYLSCGPCINETQILQNFASEAMRVQAIEAHVWFNGICSFTVITSFHIHCFMNHTLKLNWLLRWLALNDISICWIEQAGLAVVLEDFYVGGVTCFLPKHSWVTDNGNWYINMSNIVAHSGERSVNLKVTLCCRCLYDLQSERSDHNKFTVHSKPI